MNFLRKHNGTSAFRSFGTYPYRGEPDCDPVAVAAAPIAPASARPHYHGWPVFGLAALGAGGWSSAPPRHRPGPRILDVATELSLTEGYGATSIEAVAQHARISKRTFYHRFPDKTALFGAVLRRIIEELRPPAGTPLYEGRNLEEVRGRLARLMLRAVLMPKALALNRLMVAEAQRFSELAAIVAREGGRAQLVGQIAGISNASSRAGGLAIDRAAFAAQQFLQLVVSLTTPPRPRSRHTDDGDRAGRLGG